MNACPETLAAIIPAAGASRRMGAVKPLLPWGQRTVLGHILHTLHRAGVRPVLVITGAYPRLLAAEVQRQNLPHLQTVHNPGWEAGEMLSSVQVGLRHLPPTAEATFIALADQPQITTPLISHLCRAWQQKPVQKQILFPSYKRRRGHPWLVARSLWPEILELDPACQTLRDFLHTHAAAITYLNVQSPAILHDLDTPADYQRWRPDLPSTKG